MHAEMHVGIVMLSCMTLKQVNARAALSDTHPMDSQPAGRSAITGGGCVAVDMRVRRLGLPQISSSVREASASKMPTGAPSTTASISVAWE